MKKQVLVFAFALFFLSAFGAPQITDIEAPSLIDLYGLYEVAFNMGAYSNPYDPSVIDAYAVFQGPENQRFKVNAFYFEDYVFSNEAGYETASSTGVAGWRIRFTPNRTGMWTYTIFATDSQGSISTEQKQFECRNANQATGFITKANNRYIKQTKVENGQAKDALFFPVGPNIARYSCQDYGHFHQPYGIYEYYGYIDELEGNGNYFRLFINRYPFLSLYGKEYTTGVVYFDNTVNQKDSRELDMIIEYAKAHGVSVMPCFFSHNDFVSWDFYSDCPDNWPINPFHTLIPTVSRPCDYFSDATAIRITKNLIRYIASRWGYATNIMAWELWNEVNQMEQDESYFCKKSKSCDTEQYCESKPFREDVIDWHRIMGQYLKDNDPFHHLVTTSFALSLDSNSSDNVDFIKRLYAIDAFDIAQSHRYKNVDNSSDNFQNDLFAIMKKTHDQTGKPSFIGEYGFSHFGSSYWYKDPWGIEFHNSLWSASFSGAIGTASLWWWQYILKNPTVDLYTYLGPVCRFFNTLPTLSSSFYPYSNKTTLGAYPNGIEAYYLMNESCDTIFGWAHDKDFRFQKLKDNAPSYVSTLNPADRPQPCSNSNDMTIIIQNQPIGAQYLVKWYDSETGDEFKTDVVYVTKSGGDKVLSFEFPASIRDLQNNKIHNSFGDVVFAIYLDCDKMDWKYGGLLEDCLYHVGDEMVCNQKTAQVFYKTDANQIHSIWWNSSEHCWKHSELNNAATNVKKDLAIADNGTRIFYINTSDDINSIYFDHTSSRWVFDDMGGITRGHAQGPLAAIDNHQVLYRNKNGALNALWFDSNAKRWRWTSLNDTAPSGVSDAIAVSTEHQVFYKTTSRGLKAIRWDATSRKWVAINLDNSANSGVKGPIAITPNNQVFFRTTGNDINNIYYDGSTWRRSTLNDAATNVWSSTTTGKILQADLSGKVFYINSDNQVDCLYWTPEAGWKRFALPPTHHKVLSLATNDDRNVFFLTNKSTTGLNKPQVYSFLYKSQCFDEGLTHSKVWGDIDDSEMWGEYIEALETEPDENAATALPMVTVYPNPTTGRVTVSSTDVIEKAYVFDSKGNIVSSYDNHRSNTIILDLSSYGDGLYLIRTQNRNGYSTVNKINKID